MIDVEEISCPLCNGSARLMHDNFTGYQVDMKFKIYQCNNCLTSFPLPRIDSTKIYNFIYESGKKVPGYNRYWSYFENVKKQEHPLSYLANSEEAYWGIREALVEIAKAETGLKILEVGCGLGYLTYALRSENYDAQGLDISEEAIENAKRNFGDYYTSKDLFQFVKTNSEIFDIVILTEVIEHVEQPIEFIEAITKLLKKNGKIILTTPNRSLSPLDIIWDTEAPPVHHWWFGEESMKHIAKSLNLDWKFISFEKFYKNRPNQYRVKRIRKNVQRAPIINEKWELYNYGSLQKKGKIKLSLEYIESKLKFAFSRAVFLKRTFLKLKAFFNPSVILCGERGQILCVIYQKSRQ